MTLHQPMPALQRSRGRAEVTLGPGPLGPSPRRLYQEGSGKAVLHLSDAGAEVTFLNTSGGLTSGDRLDLGLTLGPGLRALGCTQTAERAYRADAGPAVVRVALAAGAGSHLDWLPQETILFDGANLDRRTTLTLGTGATALMAETIVLGRAAMGERVARVALRDDRRITRPDGTPLWAEPLVLSPGALAGPATLDGAVAMASVVLVAPGASDLLAPLRAVLPDPVVRAAASALPGRLVLRLLSPEAMPLRRLLARALGVLRGGRALPRVWQI